VPKGKGNVSVLKYSVTVRCTEGAACMKRPNRASSRTNALSKKVLSDCQNAASNSRTTHRLVLRHYGHCWGNRTVKVHTCCQFTVTWLLHDAGNKILVCCRRHTNTTSRAVVTRTHCGDFHSDTVNKTSFLFSNTAPSCIAIFRLLLI